MKFSQLLEKISQSISYIAEAFGRIFSPNKDEYPEIGVQPFEGDPNKGSSAD